MAINPFQQVPSSLFVSPFSSLFHVLVMSFVQIMLHVVCIEGYDAFLSV